MTVGNDPEDRPCILHYALPGTTVCEDDDPVRPPIMRLLTWRGALVGLTLLAGVAAMRPEQFVGTTCGDHARQSALATIDCVSVQIDLYRLNEGYYPRLLADLTTRPADSVQARKLGETPYINDPSDLKDSWGNELRYRSPGTRRPGSYDLWSMGPDHVNGTADDIGNSPPKRRP